MSVRTPNPEQKKAIEHTGGVLLSAGAGSGKTFVLVEHMIYLLKRFEENYQDDPAFLEDNLRKYLSSIVLMTFTKKAAGELQIRLHQRVAEQVEQEQNDEFWLLASKHILSMTVGTIHSFCMKLLKQGFFLHINPNVEIIDDVEAHERVKIILSKWFDKNGDGKEVFFRHIDELQDAFNGIFSSPELRLDWEKLEPSKYCHDDLSEVILKIAEYNNFKKAFVEPLDLAPYSEHSKLKWFGLATEFEQLKTSADFGKKDWFERFSLFLEKTMSGPSKKSDLPEIKAHFEQLKDIKNVFRTKKKCLDDLKQFYEAHDGAFKQWVETLKEIFNFINEYYNDLPGVTFSDLEYLVYKGLEDKKTCQKVSESYRYLIVDEFQDTSEIQFDILRKIIQDDPKRIFCVGDVKQAIYGFRGGDLGVFADCGEFVGGEPYTMTNNYRSLPSIINFNNMFFENMFKKGEGFKGKDEFTVPVVYQTVPDVTLEKHEPGAIDYSVNQVELPEGITVSKVPNAMKNELEAQSLMETIRRINEAKSGNICILYSKLSPSKYLISELMESGLGFTAQVKIPYSEEPIIGICSILLGTLIDIEGGTSRDKALNYFKVLLGSYLKILGLNSDKDLVKQFEIFEGYLNSYGLFNSFMSFIFNLGISNSNYKNNSESLEKYCDLAGGDYSKVLNYLNKFADNKFSLEFQYGENCKNIQMMTAHASKGLEFDHVFLAGIHTNSVSGSLSSFCGKRPGSFRWKKDLSQKGFYRSPWFMVEQFLEAKKQFSESKRLFYVACTRAKQTLHWVELNSEAGVIFRGSNSWVNGIASVRNEKPLDTFENVVVKQEDVDSSIDKDDLEKKELPVPMFHQDSLGVASKVSQDSSKLALIPELSVTKLAALHDCPRKFYLLNVCKLDQSDFDEELMKLKKIHLDELEQKVEDEESEEIEFKSSAGRGTFIHEEASNMIKRNLVVPNDLEAKDKKALNYVKTIISEVKDEQTEFISEKELKFPFFGFMISGIPDLVVQKNSECEVWDFKTGKRKEVSESNYWIQLKSYAYALYILGICDKSDEINLKLAYLDQEKCVDLKTNWEQVRSELFELWEKLTEYDKTNPDHCSLCPFGNICHTESSAPSQLSLW